MKILKKIVPIAVMSLLACTSFAFAADLATWQDSLPGADTAIVLGESAATTDNLGAINIASTLSTGAVGVDAITGEAEKIEASNNKLNLNETFASVEVGGFDDTELPLMLADGTYRADDGDDFDYTQKITFGALYPEATFLKDSDSPTPDEPALMIYGDGDKQFLNYSLRFTKSAKSTNTSGTLDDFEDSSIKMLGETYEIVGADVATHKITLQLMTGAVKATLNEEEEATYTIDDVTYTVKLDIVDSEGKARFIVNGESTDALIAGQIHKFTFDIELGLTEVLYQDWAGGKRQATFYLGAEKLTLEDTDYTTYGASDYIELNNDNILDLKLDIGASFDGTDLKISKIVFYWNPEDDIFMTKDGSATFPGLGSFKVSFEGLKTTSEELIEIEPDGSHKFELTVPLESGIASFDILYANGTGFLGVGKDATSKLLTNTTDYCVAGLVYDEDVHRYFIATVGDPTYESYLLKANTYDNLNNYVDIIDAVTGVTVCESETNGSTCDVGDIVINIHNVNAGENQLNYSIAGTGYCDRIYTEEGMTVYLPVESADDQGASGFRLIDTSGNQTGLYLDIWEEAPVTEIKDATPFNITLSMSGTSPNRETTVSITDTDESGGLLGYAEIGDTDNYAAYSNFSTYWLEKTGGNQNSVEIIYPGEEGDVSAYVSEITASIISGAATVGGKVTPVMDTEVDETIKGMNIISVGGSAINSITADLLGLDYPTYGTDDAWVEATGVSTIGEALIKIMDSKYTDGKYAMIVAGYEGLDTQRAAKALSEGTPALSGESVILSTVSEEVVVAS